jgi:PAS domain-containing protein
MPRVALLFGAILIGGLLLLIVFYVLLKLLRKHVQEEDRTSAPRLVTDDVAFMSSALQGVIKDLKVKEKRLAESLRAAERRVEEQARIIENLGTILPAAFCVINGEGLITLWNPLLHSLLKVDVWSRRHFEDVFGLDAQLAALLRDSLANGRTCQSEKIEWGASSEETRALRVSTMRWRTQYGGIGGVVCLIAEDK